MQKTRKDLPIQKAAKGEDLAMKEISKSYSLTLARTSSLPFVKAPLTLDGASSPSFGSCSQQEKLVTETYSPVMLIKAVKNSKEQALLKASHVSPLGGLLGGLSDEL